MSTNYYFELKLNTKELNGSPELNRHLMEQLDVDIHIGKRSGGWKPSFEKTKFYGSVKEIEEFYERNKDHLRIINEYYDELTIEELREELFEWDGARAHDFPGYYVDPEGYEFSEIEFT